MLCVRVFAPGLIVVESWLSPRAYSLARIVELSGQPCGSCGGFISLNEEAASLSLAAAFAGGAIALVGFSVKPRNRGDNRPLEREPVL